MSAEVIHLPALEPFLTRVVIASEYARKYCSGVLTSLYPLHPKGSRLGSIFRPIGSIPSERTA